MDRCNIRRWMHSGVNEHRSHCKRYIRNFLVDSFIPNDLELLISILVHKMVKYSLVCLCEHGFEELWVNVCFERCTFLRQKKKAFTFFWWMLSGAFAHCPQNQGYSCRKSCSNKNVSNCMYYLECAGLLRDFILKCVHIFVQNWWLWADY